MTSKDRAEALKMVSKMHECTMALVERAVATDADVFAFETAEYIDAYSSVIKQLTEEPAE